MVDFENRIVTSTYSASRIKPVNGKNHNLKKRQFKKRFRKDKKNNAVEKEISYDILTENDNDKRDSIDIMNDTQGKIINITV